MRATIMCILFLCVTVVAPTARASGADRGPSPADLAFYETNVRPLLVDKCYACHSADAAKVKGGLRVDDRAALLKGGDAGPAVVPGDPGKSLFVAAVRHADADLKMPPKEKLSASQVADLERWVALGAPMPAGKPPAANAGGINWTKAREHWAFRRLAAVEPPAVKDGSRVRNAVDRFVQAKLEERELTPVGEAEKLALVRRLFFTTIGVPPAPADVDAFLADDSPGAYDRLADRLLADPRFGERWAAHWLDVARYGDSGGYEEDLDRPGAHFYRDFVIRAFNADLPYDRFVQWQMAGDELAPGDKQAVAATGFATAGPAVVLGRKKKDAYDERDDVVNTTAQAFLGLTVGCARCHDHKYDPVTDREYYGLVAAFASAERKDVPVSDAAHAAYQAELKAWEAAVAAAKAALDAWVAERKAPLREPKIAALKLSVEDEASLRESLDPIAREKHPDDARRKVLTAIYEKHRKAIDVSDKALEKTLSDADRKQRDKLAAAVAEAEKRKPVEPPTILALGGSGVGKAHRLERGDPEREVEPIAPGFLSAVTPGVDGWGGDAWARWSPDAENRNPRTALARWLTDARDGAGALAARVIVNRLWQHHMGQGLVRTPNDFGAQGTPPTHPELLDYLAGELVRNGWQLKPIHKLIVTSAAYRRSSAVDAATVARDPANELWSYRRPARLEGEALRDAMLATGGVLNGQMFGPGVKPYMPAEAIFRNEAKYGEVWPTNVVDGPATWRRSVYVFRKRNNPFPFFQAFDAPDLQASAGRRNVTTVAPQALALLNDPTVRDLAQRFADRVANEAGIDPAARVALAYRLALGRPPTAGEAEEAGRVAGQGGAAGLVQLCHALFACNEFAYVE